MQYNSFEERINRKLATASMPPREEVWEGIRPNLGGPPPNNHRKWLLLGVCMLVCILGTGILLFTTQHKTKDIAVAKQQSAKGEKVEAMPKEKENKGVIAESAKQGLQKKGLTNEQASNKANTEKLNLSKTPVSVTNNPTKGHISSVEKQPESIDVSSKNTPVLAQVNKGNEVGIEAKNSVIEDKGGIELEKSTIVMPIPHSIPPIAGTLADNIQKQSLINEVIYTKQKPFNSDIFREVPRFKGQNRWTWNVSMGTYAILYQSYFNLGNTNQATGKNSRQLEALGVANIGVGDSTSNLVVYNDQTLNLAIGANKVGDTSLLKMTVSPTTQFATVSGEYRLTKRSGLEGGLSLYYQKMNRILIPTDNITNFEQTLANSKTYQSNTSAIPFKFYILEPKIIYNAHIAKGRSDIGIGGGISYRALVASTDSKVALRIAQIASKDAQIYNRHNASVLLRTKYTYHIADNFGVFGALNTQILLRRMYSEGISYKTPMMFGVEMGVSF